MKFRRILLSLVAATGLVALPLVAWADGYGAEDFTSTVSTTSPALGQPFAVTVIGPPDTEVTLTVTSADASTPGSAIEIAASKARERTTDSAGKVTFGVTLDAPGTYTLDTTVSANGELIDRQVVVVPGAVGGAGGGSNAAAGSGSSGALSETGFDALPIALGSAALVLLGVGAVALTRTRRASSR
jgi:hypothetical protein